jgi:hypothetical protein
MYGPWDHALVWHCTFPKANFYINTDDAGYGFSNSSFIGNVFYTFSDATPGPGNEPAYALPDNAGNNEFLYNHFYASYTDVDNCAGNPQPPGCPLWNTKSPDSESTGSQSLGTDVIDVDLPATVNFGYPRNGSIVIDRLPFATVPADAFGRPRDGLPDLGALEYPSQTSPQDAGVFSDVTATTDNASTDLNSVVTDAGQSDATSLQDSISQPDGSLEDTLPGTDSLAIDTGGSDANTNNDAVTSSLDSGSSTDAGNSGEALIGAGCSCRQSAGANPLCLACLSLLCCGVLGRIRKHG